eukprot:1981821-Rhodomonas_salina.2
MPDEAELARLGGIQGRKKRVNKPVDIRPDGSTTAVSSRDREEARRGWCVPDERRIDDHRPDVALRSEIAQPDLPLARAAVDPADEQHRHAVKRLLVVFAACRRRAG